MARIRTIKPEFWTSEQIVECSTNARLLFVGMWNFCDDNGIHPASVRRLKMEIFPGDDFTFDDIESMVQELKRNSLITEYVANNEAFWLVNGFTKHQKIDRPTYRFPLPGDTVSGEADTQNSTTPRRVLDETSTTDHPRKGMESKGMESKGSNTEKTVAKTSFSLVSFCKVWNEWHEAGIVSKKIQNPEKPGKGLQDAWRRSQADSEQRSRLEDLQAIRIAIQSANGFLHGKGWFDAVALIGGKNSSNRRFYAEMLLNGAYSESVERIANSEDDWPTVLEVVHQKYSPDLRNAVDVQAALTREQFAAAQSVGLKRIANADKFDKGTAEAYRAARKAVA